MKKIFFLLILLIPSLGFSQYYQCEVRTIANPGCEGAMSAHYCQIYDNDYDISWGVPSYCENECFEKSGYRKECVVISVGISINPEAHEGVNGFFSGLFFPKIKKPSSEENVVKNNSNEFLVTICDAGFELVKDECVYKCEFDEVWENNQCVPEVVLSPNEYKIINVENNSVIYFIDCYGQESYSLDGHHYYDNPYTAINPGPINSIGNWFSENIMGLPGKIFSAKLSDSDLELQRQVGREVLRDFKKKSDKKLDLEFSTISSITSKAVEFATNSVALKLANVPALSVKEFAREADETEFAQGVMIYIAERKDNRSPENIYDEPPEQLQGEGGGLNTVSMIINAKFPKALLFSKYEEAYQRYLASKEIVKKIVI